MTHATFLLASGNVRATTGQSKLKRVTANQKWRAPRGENLRSENIEPKIILSGQYSQLCAGWCQRDPAVVLGTVFRT
jgi:hypothetical protein